MAARADARVLSYRRKEMRVTSRERPLDFLVLTLAISITVFTGFWFTYFGPTFAGQYPKVSPMVHVHGWSFFAWYLLLPLQAGLVRARRMALHRTLGYASLLLATIMVVSGLTVIGARMAEAAADREPSFWTFAGPGIFSTLVLFTAFYAAAVVLRKQSARHKRLMLVASAGGMGAAMWRVMMVIFGQVMWILPASIVLTNVFIVAGMALDWRRERRVHKEYVIGLVVCMATELVVYFGTPTAMGGLLSRALAAMGGVLQVLY